MVIGSIVLEGNFISELLWIVYHVYSLVVITVQKQQAQKASSSDYVQSKMAQLKSLEQELQKKTMSVADQIKQSEANLLAHEKAISVQQQVLLTYICM